MFRFILFALQKGLLVQKNTEDRYKMKDAEKGKCSYASKIGEHCLDSSCAFLMKQAKRQFLKRTREFLSFSFISLVPLLFLP